MEGDGYHRRQYDQQYPSERFVPNSRAMSRDVSDRIRPTQQLSSIRSPTSASRTGTAGGTNPALTNYVFPQSQQYTTPVQDTSLQYQPGFGQDPHRQQNHQFSQYSQTVLYNSQPSTQSQSPYDPVQPYQPRHSAAIEVLSSQFGVPQYYTSSESTSIAGPAPITQQYTTEHHPQYQNSGSTARTAMATPYSSILPEYPQGTAPNQPETHEALQENNHDTTYNGYLESLGQIFQNVRNGRLAEAAQSLLDISEWLIGSADDLGLTRDQQDLHSERLKLWKDFNTCWLAVLQKQKDTTQEMMASGRNVLPPQSVIDTSFLNHMGEKLVSLSDGMESHGLVDYEMGVWEEEIISVLTDCLALLENHNQGNQEGSSSSQPANISSGSR